MVKVDLGLSNTLAVEAAPSTPPRQPGLAAALAMGSPPLSSGDGAPAPPPPYLQLGVLEGRLAGRLMARRDVPIRLAGGMMLSGFRLPLLYMYPGIPGVADVSKDRILYPTCAAAFKPDTYSTSANSTQITPYGIITSQVSPALLGCFSAQQGPLVPGTDH